MHHKKFRYLQEGELPFAKKKLQCMLQNPNAVKKSQTSNPGNIKLTCIDRIHIYIKDTLKIIEF